MNLINEETEWEHFSHSLVSCLCCPLFPPSSPVPLFLLPQKQLMSLPHTHELWHQWGGKTETGRWKIPCPWLLLSSDNLTNILSLWQGVLSDCWGKQGSHDYTACFSSSSSSSLTSFPLEEGAWVTFRGKPREIPDQNGNCQGPEGHHL